MIDTIRFRGPAKNYSMKLDVTKYQVWVDEKTGNITQSPIVTIGNIKAADGQSLYRIFYTPSADMVDVELNIQKILFNHNASNYCFSANSLNLLIRRFGSYFFASGSYYVTRIDLGFVQTLDTEAEKRGMIDTFRNTRLPGSYTAKYKAQYYANSVWYPSKNFIMKIYDKHAEIVKHETKEIADKIVPNNNMVRFEKQYRGKEIERVSALYNTEKKKQEDGKVKEVKTLIHYAMPHEAFRGIHIDSFDISYLKDDLFSTLSEWVRNTATIEGQELKGTQGLLDALAKRGMLSEVEAAHIVNRTTIYRYKKRAAEIGRPSFQVIPDDVAEVYKNRVNYAVSVGVSKIIQDRQNKK